jgi:hypothetical protein
MKQRLKLDEWQKKGAADGEDGTTTEEEYIDSSDEEFD